MGPELDTSRNRLPSHHVSRPRLSGACADDHVVVLEAPGGYGKSVLAAELVDSWVALPIWVLFDEGGLSARLLSSRLRAAVNAAGLRDTAGLMAAAGDDPPGVIDAMLAGLAAESCAIVLDDAHRADRGAVELIDRIIAQRSGATRVVIVARQLPHGISPTRLAPARRFVADQLALEPEETLRLCRDGFGLEVSAADGHRLDLATGGWTAAVVLAATRAGQGSEALGDLTRARPGRGDLLATILEHAVTESGITPQLFAQVAALPLLDAQLLSEVTGDPDFLSGAIGWGLPVSRSADGWWVLPDPVREHLMTLGPLDRDVLAQAAAHYRRHGELGRALQMLLAAGDAAGAAELLARSDPWVIDRVDALELLSVLDRIPAADLRAHPRAQLNVARCLAAGWLHDHAARLLAELDTQVDGVAEPALRRAIDAELLTDRLNREFPGEFEAPTRALLAATAEDETLTRARAMTLVGQALCRSRDETGALAPEVLREALRYFERAIELHLSLGNLPAAATTTLFTSMWVHWPLGRPDEALAELDRGVTWAADHPRRLVRIRFCRAYNLCELGRQDEMDAELAEVERLGREMGDRWMLAYVELQRMVAASMRGDTAAVLEHSGRLQAERGAWWSVEGAEFLAEAAESLNRVGEKSLATELLQRAQEDPQQAGALITMAECALLARHGDPALARRKLAGATFHGINPREQWRVTLLDAYAAMRQGDPGAGAIAARAFQQAVELGQPLAPLRRERDLTDALLGVAVETGMAAAAALEATSLPTAVAVLGRFELTVGGRSVTLGAGQERRLLKLVAVSGGQIPVEQAIESLWPEAAPAAGRNRLRTVLSRLREAAGEVLVRDGAQLAVADDVHLDLAAFDAEVRAAQALGVTGGPAALAEARSAMARYRGRLLPGDLHEEWAEEPRRRTERSMLAMLELCADIAIDHDDLDEARRMIERSIALAPSDEDLYLRVATILREQGRRGAALSILRAAKEALAGAGISPPPALLALEGRVADQ